MIKHFIDINQLSKKEIDKIILNAKLMKKNPTKFKKIFNNKTLGLLFQKKSMRTRVSFVAGVQKLGGKTIELDEKAIGFGKRESEEDILKVLSQYIDCLIIRNDNHNKLLKYASLNYISIINGLSNYSHPCQILSDYYTIQEEFGKSSNVIISWIGDYNNVLRSLVQLQNIYSFKLKIILPKSIIKINYKEINNIKNKNVLITSDIEKGIAETNCVMTDVWISMGEKNKNKKQFLKKFQVNTKIMEMADKKAIFMHCLPAHRGEEVTNDVIDGPKSVVWKQSRNRLFVQQSILKYIFNK